MGVADVGDVGAVLGPPEVPGPGADSDPGVGGVRIHRRLPELVAAAAAEIENLLAARRLSGSGRLAPALELLPLVAELAGHAGRDRHDEEKRCGRTGRDRRVAPRDRHQAGVAGIAHEAAEPELRQRDRRADRERDPEQLAALALGGRRVQPAIERVALLHGGEEDRRAHGGEEQRQQLRDPVGREQDEGREGDHRRRHGQARGGQPEGERDKRQRSSGERLARPAFAPRRLPPMPAASPSPRTLRGRWGSSAGRRAAARSRSPGGTGPAPARGTTRAASATGPRSRRRRRFRA